MIVSFLRSGPVLVAYMFGLWRFGLLAEGFFARVAPVRRLFGVSGVRTPLGAKRGLTGHSVTGDFRVSFDITAIRRAARGLPAFVVR